MVRATTSDYLYVQGKNMCLVVKEVTAELKFVPACYLTRGHQGLHEAVDPMDDLMSTVKWGEN